MKKDVLEIFLDQLSLEYTGNRENPVSLICTLNWHYPRENVSVLSSVIPLFDVTSPYVKDFADSGPSSLAYADRILFKEERLGNSYFGCDIFRIDDPGVFGEVAQILLQYLIKNNAQGLVASGLDVLLKQLNLDQRHMLKIASGRAELNGDRGDGELLLPLKIDSRIALQASSDDFGDEIEQESVLEPGTANGSLRLRFSRLG